MTIYYRWLPVLGVWRVNGHNVIPFVWMSLKAGLKLAPHLSRDSIFFSITQDCSKGSLISLHPHPQPHPTKWRHSPAGTVLFGTIRGFTRYGPKMKSSVTGKGRPEMGKYTPGPDVNTPSFARGALRTQTPGNGNASPTGRLAGPVVSEPNALSFCGKHFQHKPARAHTHTHTGTVFTVVMCLSCLLQQ